jgi:hypothetical protein
MSPETSDCAINGGAITAATWPLKLHTYGLLNNSFQPPAEIRVLPFNSPATDPVVVHHLRERYC